MKGSEGIQKGSSGNDLLSQGPASQVPSALEGLTTWFGMEQGISPPLQSPKGTFMYFSSRVWHPKTEQDVSQNTFSFVRIKPSAISTAKLNTLLCLHPPPIQQVVYLRPYSHEGMGDLILRRASHLDAFSGYHCQTWLPSYAVGTTTGTPAVCPPRSSRTRGNSSQIPCAHSG